MTTDAHATAFRLALEYCGSLVARPGICGAPLLVSALDADAVPQSVVFPPRVINAGDPVLELLVQSDGVLAIAGLRLRPLVKPSAASFFAYPQGGDGLPVMAGHAGGVWLDAVETWVLDALAVLPTAGQALAGP